MFVTDLVALYKDRDFDPVEDKIYEIGPEVKLELNVKMTPVKPVYRGVGMNIITTNRIKPITRGHEGADH